MSVASTNFFSVLGDDSAGPEVGTGAVHLEKGQPKVAQPTSSKKLDQNPRADPSKARKKAPGPPSNERILRENQEGGRANNKKVSVKEGATAHSSRRHDRNDRQNLSGKRDTGKRVRSGWGDDSQAPEDELAGEDIAAEQAKIEEAEDREDEAAVEAQRVTLEQYLQSQKEEKQSLNTRKTGSGAGLSTSDKSSLANATELKPTPEVEEPEARKKLRNKQRKEIQTIEPDFSAARPLVRSDRPERSDRAPRAPRGDRSPRGERSERSERPPRSGGKPTGKPAGKPATKDAKSGKPAAKTGGKPAGKPAAAKSGKGAKPSAPKVDLASLPSLG